MPIWNFLSKHFVFWLQTNNLKLNLKPIVGLLHYVPRTSAVIHACECPQCSIYLDNILLIFGIRYSSCLWISSLHHSSLIFDIWGEVQFMLVNIKCASLIAYLWHLGQGTVHACEYQVRSRHCLSLTFGASYSSCLWISSVQHSLTTLALIWGEVQFILACGYPVLSIYCDICLWK